MEEIVNTDSTAGIRDIPVTPERAINSVVLKSRTHYVFYAGEPGEGGKGISQIAYRNGLTFIQRGVVTQVDNFAYWDRDQDDRIGMPAVRHPDPRRLNEVRQVLYAADIVDTLINLWGMQGLVSITAAIDVPASEVKRLVKQILPTVPATNPEMLELLGAAMLEFEHDTLGFKIAESMVSACRKAEHYGRVHLARMRSEMEMHRVGKDGIAALDEPAYRWIKTLGLSKADYEVDTQNLHQALASSLGGPREPIVIQQAPADPNIIAAAVMAAMQHLESQKKDPVAAVATDINKQLFESEPDLGDGNLIAEAVRKAEEKPKKGK